MLQVIVMLKLKVSQFPFTMHMYVHLFRATWVKVSGVLYKKPCALLLRVKDDYPQFGKLKDIFVLNSARITCFVQIIETSTFSSLSCIFCL